MSSVIDPTPLIKAEDAAAILCVSGRTLWTLTNAGEIPCVRIGRSLRYDPSDLHRWIQKRKRKSRATSTKMTTTKE